MTTEDDIKAFELRWNELIDAERATHDSKRAQYTGGADPLANYRQAAEGLATLLQVGDPHGASIVRDRGGLFPMAIRLAEKLHRGFVALSEGRLLDEEFLDVAIIAKLMIIESERVSHAAGAAGYVMSPIDYESELRPHRVDRSG